MSSQGFFPGLTFSLCWLWEHNPTNTSRSLCNSLQHGDKPARVWLWWALEQKEKSTSWNYLSVPSYCFCLGKQRRCCQASRLLLLLVALAANCGVDTSDLPVSTVFIARRRCAGAASLDTIGGIRRRVFVCVQFNTGLLT